MKLLLTSGGLINDILRNKFLELIGKNPPDVSVAFIDTASNVERDTSFVDKDIENLKKTGVNNISRIDIAELKEKWIEILKNADVVWVDGGNTFYLLDEIRKSGLDKELGKIMIGKLYVGVSAGSIIVTPSIAVAGVEPGDPNDVGMTNFVGLNWVDFELSPHTPSWVPLNKSKEYAKGLGRKLYVYDDGQAVLVQDRKVEFIGTGFAKIY